MSIAQIVVLVVAGLIVLGIAGVIALLIAYGLARRPDRAAVRPVLLDEIDDYFARRASFAVTVRATTPLARDEVFTRLISRPYLSSLPFLSGPMWASTARGTGATRTFSGTFYSVAERVLVVTPGREITLTGIGVCTPLTIRSFAERFVIDDGDRSGVLVVSWTIAGGPRWVGWLPWRIFAPATRPVFAFVLRHILRLGPFRAPRSSAQ